MVRQSFELVSAKANGHDWSPDNDRDKNSRKGARIRCEAQAVWLAYILQEWASIVCSRVLRESLKWLYNFCAVRVNLKTRPH